uniref:Uncharacterized protein n=1 Tax=Klebsiella pneumoniae TaxID=573 RepID=A0A8B0SNN1_KLEPN|nr:hypothetical protein [Klebsiella pneumoniae]
MQWQREQGQLRSEALERENRAMKNAKDFLTGQGYVLCIRIVHLITT